MTAHITMLDAIRMGAVRRVVPKPCPFCGTDAPLAAHVHGRYVIACENDDCPADVQVAGATNEEAWARWNTRA